jgi:hypothetical protein
MCKTYGGRSTLRDPFAGWWHIVGNQTWQRAKGTVIYTYIIIFIYTYIYIYYTYEYIRYMRFKKNKNNHVKSQFWISEISPWIGPVTCWDAPAQSVTQKWGCSLTGVPSRHQTAANVHPDLVLKWMCCGYSDRADLYLCYLSISTQGCSCTLSTGCRQGYHISQVDISFSIQPSLYPQL